MVIWIGVRSFFCVCVYTSLSSLHLLILYFICRVRKSDRKRGNGERDIITAAKKSVQIWWHFYEFFFMETYIISYFLILALNADSLTRLLVCLLALSVLIFRHIFFLFIAVADQICWFVCVLFFSCRVYVFECLSSTLSHRVQQFNVI